MFSVAHFMKTDDVAVVPTRWIKNGTAPWPPFKNTAKVNSAVRDRTEPGKDWPKFACRVMSYTDSYEVARKRSIKAEEESDLTSEAETSQKRIRRPPTFFDDYLTDSSDEEGVTEEPPPEGDIEFLAEPPPPPPLQRKSGAHCGGAGQTDGDDLVLPKGRPKSASSLNCSAEPSSKALVTVLRELECIKAQLTSMATMLARIQMHVNADDPTAMAGPVHPEDLPVYPVKTREEFAFLEASLKNEAIFAKLVKELGQIGGRDVASTTKTVFKKLVGDEVAVFYNRTGRNGKQEAGKLKIFSLIYAAVRVTRKTATDDEMGRAIGDWLRFANVRLRAQGSFGPIDKRCTNKLSSGSSQGVFCRVFQCWFA
ncbi:uncharacterized protein LOC120837814 isoform X2 [Ixodes scapularis]|nr:uncharacterized protein LOC115317149 isoform X2 [Ixodes scapularis]XP_040066023.1 uncharacterized protein LOC115322445 [Ixodes scapularis]XP_040067300.1 uncharacterized protein LOC120840722 isoform X2 [Ixodes scapularis]XP_040067655.2 uncharacterized protein LOC120840930 isoform X2 [Ixodes scapularis]XP_040068542.1 uncharacterized protein LOC120841671 isoform X2 [Ixodes scapularis]XP_040071008.1 uncharacterized protein LOC115313879 isoform X2 [Ixodes scapularis]XP_040071581.1 uncharacteriz